MAGKDAQGMCWLQKEVALAGICPRAALCSGEALYSVKMSQVTTQLYVEGGQEPTPQPASTHDQCWIVLAKRLLSVSNTAGNAP